MADGFTLAVTDGALGAINAGPGRALLLIGISSAGTTGVVNAFEDPSDAQAALGYGPLSEMAAFALSVGANSLTSRPVGCVRVATTSAGSNGSVTATRTGTSTGTVTVAGSPLDTYSVKIRITRTGTVGTGAFRYSLDGGRSESVEYAIPAGGTFVLTGTGLTITFVPGGGAVFFEAVDYHTFASVGPTYDTTALNTALDVMAADSRDWPLVMIVGAPAGADNAAKTTAAAALIAAVQTKADAYAALGRYLRVIVEAPDVSADSAGATALTGGLTTTTARRTLMCAGYLRIPSQILPRQMRVSSAWPVVARLASLPFSQDPGDGGLGSLDGIIGGTLETTTAERSLYDAGRVICLQTINGVTGYVTSNSATFAPTGSDYAEVMNCRVIDEGSRAGRAKLLQYRRSRIRVGKAGTPAAGKIDERDAQLIENSIRSAISNAIINSGNATDVSVAIPRGDNLLSTNKLRARIRITPFAYAKTIEAEIGLDNPALQAV